MLRTLGADAGVGAAAAAAPSAGAVLALAGQHDLDGALAAAVARRAREVALASLGGGTDVDIVVVDRAGAVLGRAGP